MNKNPRGHRDGQYVQLHKIQMQWAVTENTFYFFVHCWLVEQCRLCSAWSLTDTLISKLHTPVIVILNFSDMHVALK